MAEAHLLWHQALEKYHDPDAFRANLNATIEALRNVTFVLQNEKEAFGRFDEWYGPWRERLKANPMTAWLHEARTTVVHQGELEGHSWAEVRLVTWHDVVLARLDVPVGTPSSLILRNLPLLSLLVESRVTPEEARDAAVMVERRWTTADLGSLEVLEALGRAYGLLSVLVADAHARLKCTDCIPHESDHPDFRSTYERTEALGCMLAGADKRTQIFQLSTGAEVVPNLTQETLNVDPGEALERYGPGERGPLVAWESMDPVRLAEKVLFQAKRILRRDKFHGRMMFIRDGKGSWHIRALRAADRTEKYLLLRIVAQFVERMGCDAIVEASEMWATRLRPHSAVSNDALREPEKREELLSVMVATREGFYRNYLTPFTRGPFGGIRLGPTETVGGNFPPYLAPVVNVWREQGLVRLGDGKTVLRVWEPDPLDTCFCGGPARFGECCRRRIPNPPDISREIQEAMATSQFGRAEELSRAALAQYVIWVKQHTVPTMHVAPGLYGQLVAVDAAALGALVASLEDCMEASGKADFVVPQLLHLAEAIGVPRLSMRLMALASEWLVRSGKIEEAVLQMDSLGDLESVEDDLALTMAVRLLDLPIERQEKLLRRAISAAASPEERDAARIELAERMLGAGKKEKALSVVDSMVAEPGTSEDPEDGLGEAFLMRWRITRSESDLLSAKKLLADDRNAGRRRRCAAVLIDEGRHEEAEKLLASDVGGGDVVAKLLTVDARVRAGKLGPAKDLLLDIEEPSLPRHLRLAYATAAAELALSSGDDSIREVAIRTLRSLPQTLARGHVEGLLRALRGDGSGS